MAISETADGDEVADGVEIVAVEEDVDAVLKYVAIHVVVRIMSPPIVCL